MRACGLEIPPPLLVIAVLMHRSLSGTPSPEAGDVDIGLAVAFGLCLSAVCAPLLAQYWGDGWHRPLADWQQELGIAALLLEIPSSEVAQT